MQSIEGALGSTVVAVMLVGPAVHPDRPDRARHPELLVIADALAPTILATLADAIRPYMKQGVRVRTLTEQELRSSLDAYALEIAEWKDHHVLLSGRPVLESLSISRQHLRLDLERALRGLGRRLRNRLLHTMAARSGDLDTVLLEAFERLLVVARQCLRFAGQDMPEGQRATLEAFASYVEVDAAPLLAMLEGLRQGTKSRGAGPSEALAELDAILQTACRVIDAAEVEA